MLSDWLLISCIDEFNSMLANEKSFIIHFKAVEKLEIAILFYLIEFEVQWKLSLYIFIRENSFHFWLNYLYSAQSLSISSTIYCNLFHVVQQHVKHARENFKSYKKKRVADQWNEFPLYWKARKKSKWERKSNYFSENFAARGNYIHVRVYFITVHFFIHGNFLPSWW